MGVEMRSDEYNLQSSTAGVLKMSSSMQEGYLFAQMVDKAALQLSSHQEPLSTKKVKKKIICSYRSLMSY